VGVQTSIDTGEAHAKPIPGDYTTAFGICQGVHRANFHQRHGLALRNYPGSRPAYGGCRASRHGAGRQPALYQLPSRPQSGSLVAVDLEQTAVEFDHSSIAAAWAAFTPCHR